ncbi:hypothetical protein [Phenylobacterium sp.]|jgi:hypothetical protein|uniref:hypothetical protein n=1 Tax=Phenylobacterium sp. TaxID=1871053 RepID=UPI002F924AA6
MRTALASLVLAAGLATAAQAQDQAAQPATPATQAPPAATTPAPPAATATPPAAEAAPPAPTLPTTGTGAAVLQILERICVPAVRGQSPDQTAKGMGFKQNKRDGTWTTSLGTGDKNHVIIVLPQYSQKDVCRAEVRYPIGQDAPIVSALNVWSFLHQPELILQANYVNTDPDGLKRVRKSWEHLEANASTAVNFTVERKADDTPVHKAYDRGILYYQERKF